MHSTINREKIARKGASHSFNIARIIHIIIIQICNLEESLKLFHNIFHIYWLKEIVDLILIKYHRLSSSHFKKIISRNSSILREYCWCFTFFSINFEIQFNEIYISSTCFVQIVRKKKHHTSMKLFSTHAKSNGFRAILSFSILLIICILMFTSLHFLLSNYHRKYIKHRH